jgi:amino acid adenylation domain-containing protein
MLAEQHDSATSCWLNEFKGTFNGSSFPADHRQPRVRSGRRESALIRIEHACWSNFNVVCSREGLTLRDATLGLLQILIHRYTLTDSIELGVQCGKVFPVVTEIDRRSSVRDSLFRTAEATSEASVKGCSWEELRAWASKFVPRVDQPLFRVFFSVSDPDDRQQGRQTVSVTDDASQLQFDLLLSLSSSGAQPVLEAHYDSNLYTRKTIDEILAQLAYLISNLETSLDRTIEHLPLWSTRDAAALIEELAGKEKEVPVGQCMHQRFEDQVRRRPDAFAVVMPAGTREQLTYLQVNERANRLAHYLRSKGVGPDVLVGLYVDRTPDLIVALLAILKAGGAYLPIDLSYPAERVAFMLSDSEAPIVIADEETAAKLPPTNAVTVCIDRDEHAWASLSSENPPSSVTSQNLAYSIFTSGSTGRPKGVLITHANVSRLFDATQPWFHFSEQDTWTFFHSSAFDFSVWEIWGALIYGGRLVVVPFADSRSPERFYDLLLTEGVTVLNQTPSAFRQVIGVDERRPGTKLNKLRLVIFGGEALNLQSLGPWFDKYGDVAPQLVNMYGITETTVHVTYRPLTISDLSEAPGSVIGIPIPDLQLYVLDPALQPVPVGVPGEMFVGGGGVARGYLRREALTKERFIPNPFSREEGETLYRSGDLARRLPGGDLEYLGRADQQVKIRGFRVELGEIQSALTRQASVREAFVLANESCDGERFLVAYIVPASGQAPGVDKLRSDLQSILPGYMVPAHFVFLDHLPLTTNGKIDRCALPPASTRRSSMEQSFRAPENKLELEIARVWQEILSLDRVGIDDNFFDLGGNSLRLAEVHSRLQKMIGSTFSITDLFAHTTVRQVAALLTRAETQLQLGKELLSRAQRQRQVMTRGRNRRR